MKIAFLSFYSGLVDRGVETHVHHLSSRLSERHQVNLYQAGSNTSQDNYHQVKYKTTMKWPDISSTALTRRLFIDYYSRKITLFTLRTLPSIIKFQPDIILPFNGGMQVYLAKLYTQFTSCKLVLSAQAGLGWDEKVNLRSSPDLYILPAASSKEWLNQVKPQQNHTVIPNGVDLRNFKQSIKPKQIANIKKELQLNGNKLILCVAGREKAKRVEETIKAVAMTDYHLLVLGGSKTTQEYGDKYLKHRYHQKKVPHKEMPNYYHAADLFTLVSKASEAFGIAYIEAMAANLPCVATDDPLRREIIGQAGLFVKNPNSSSAYATKLQQAMKVKWQNAPQKQAQKFDYDQIAEQYEQAFNQLKNS